MEAVAKKIPMLTRAELLGQLMANYKTPIAVSGTHGKTTTTSMISHVLLAGATDPTISVGGILQAIGGNIRVGSSGIFVTEACEYTNSFLHFFPKISIILNIEADHLDFFKDLEDIRHSFHQFAALLPSDGTLIINGEIDQYQEICEGLDCSVVTYGMSPEFDYSAQNITYDEKGRVAFDFFRNGKMDTHIVLSVTGDHNVQAQKVKDSNQIIIKTQTLNLDEREALNNALADKFGVDTSTITAENISSTVSSEMRQDAIIAVIISAICMLIYIWFRFKDVRFASSAVLALLHDLLFVLTFYALARTSVGNTFIACMLTILGYSINATIVIFDRIREELRVMKRNDDLKALVNRSITYTLTRSIYTTFTTFVMVAVLYIMGVSSIKEFAAPLMVGIAGGGYSSVCITGALWYVMKTKIGGKKAAKKK